MIELIPLLTYLLNRDPAVLLLFGTLIGAATVPVYILGHAFKLARMPPGTEGWNPVGFPSGNPSR